MHIINDENYQEFVTEPGMAKGLVPRNFDEHPVGMGSSEEFGKQMKLIPRQEWPERCQAMEANKTRLSDIRNRGNNGQPIPSLDQNGQGFCWAYSTTAAVQLLRAKANMPYHRLSAHAVACKIFNFQDRGAWGALSMDFIAKNGVPTIDHWPEKSMRRENDRFEVWENAKRHAITEGWIDIDIQHASEARLTFDQVATCYLQQFPVVSDFNWWGHSVCGMDLVDLKPHLGQQGLNDPNRWGNRILNSWTDNWKDNGTSVLQGSKAVPNGASSPRAVVVT